MAEQCVRILVLATLIVTHTNNSVTLNQVTGVQR